MVELFEYKWELTELAALTETLQCYNFWFTNEDFIAVSEIYLMHKRGNISTCQHDATNVSCVWKRAIVTEYYWRFSMWTIDRVSDHSDSSPYKQRYGVENMLGMNEIWTQGGKTDTI